MGLFISLLYNADKLTTYLQENVLMVLYFEGEVSESVLNERADSIASLDFVRSTKAITAEEAALEYREVIEKDFVDILGNNPLPASIEVQLAPGVHDFSPRYGLDPMNSNSTYPSSTIIASVTSLSIPIKTAVARSFLWRK